MLFDSSGAHRSMYQSKEIEYGRCFPVGDKERNVKMMMPTCRDNSARDQRRDRDEN